MCLVLETANPVAKADEQQPMAELQEQSHLNLMLAQEEAETLVEKMERRSLDNSADSNVVAKLMTTEGKLLTIRESMTAEPARDPTQVGFVLYVLCSKMIHDFSTVVKINSLRQLPTSIKFVCIKSSIFISKQTMFWQNGSFYSMWHGCSAVGLETKRDQ